jgi:hypothetical protein
LVGSGVVKKLARFERGDKLSSGFHVVQVTGMKSNEHANWHRLHEMCLFQWLFESLAARMPLHNARQARPCRLRHRIDACTH